MPDVENSRPKRCRVQTWLTVIEQLVLGSGVSSRPEPSRAIAACSWLVRGLAFVCFSLPSLARWPLGQESGPAAFSAKSGNAKTPSWTGFCACADWGGK